MTGILDISAVLLELGLTSAPTEVQRAVIGSAITRAESAVRRHLMYDPAQAARTEYYPQQAYGGNFGGGIWDANDTEAYIRSGGGAGDVLLVRHIPVRLITTLHIDYDARSGTRSGAFGASSLKVEGTDYWPNYDGVDSLAAKVCRDGIIRSQGLWPSEPGSVKIVYVAGYSAAELAGTDDVIDASPIMDALLVEAVRRARRALSRQYNAATGIVAGALASESLGDYSYSVTPDKGMVYGEGQLSAEASEMLSTFVNIGFQLAS